MKLILRLIATSILAGSIISCSKYVSGPSYYAPDNSAVENGSDSSGFDLSSLARMFAALPIGLDQMEEVKDAASASIGNGYDEEYIPESKNKMVQQIKKEGPDMQYLSEFPSQYGRYVAIDAELTGLDEKEDQLLELAACEIKNGEITNKRFHAYINPRGEIKGTEFHGITKETK